MLTIMLSAAVAFTPQADLNRGVAPRIMEAALSAPESPQCPGEGQRYCVVGIDQSTSGDGHAPPTLRRLGRTEREWIALGVFPLAD